MSGYSTGTYNGQPDGCGAVFSIQPDGSNATKATKAYTFDGTTGIVLTGGIIQGADDLLYGTTHYGGKKIVQGGTVQYGTIFRIKTDGTNFEKLHAFGGAGDGSFPDGGLVQYEDSDLYGLTLRGGTNDKGVLFKLKDEDLSYQKLYDFDSTLGGNPRGSLVRWKE